MTYKEKYTELLTSAHAAWDKFLKADKELSSTNGFGNMSSVPAYNRAYNDWQFATNNFNNFVSWLRGKNINPDDEFSG